MSDRPSSDHRICLRVRGFELEIAGERDFVTSAYGDVKSAAIAMFNRRLHDPEFVQGGDGSVSLPAAADATSSPTPTNGAPAAGPVKQLEGPSEPNTPPAPEPKQTPAQRAKDADDYHDMLLRFQEHCEQRGQPFKHEMRGLLERAMEIPATARGRRIKAREQERLAAAARSIVRGTKPLSIKAGDRMPPTRIGKKRAAAGPVPISRRRLVVIEELPGEFFTVADVAKMADVKLETVRIACAPSQKGKKVGGKYTCTWAPRGTEPPTAADAPTAQPQLEFSTPDERLAQLRRQAEAKALGKQCSACGYEPADPANPPRVCPKCNSTEWETKAGDPLQIPA